MKYSGLTKYFTVRHWEPAPDGLAEWARVAYTMVAKESAKEGSI